jgi:amidase
MSNDDILLQAAGRQRDALVARRLSAADLLDLTLARITAINPAVNAVVTLDEAGARAAALESDRRLAAGAARPLEGLPITIKDALDVAGLRSTAGAPAFKERVPDADAAVVARLRAAGAIIVGKTNVPVFSADFQTANPIFGVTKHPADATLSPGGSSGGAAVAVATGMTSFETGTDLGSSIRWPSAACGVFGLKTSWGLVSTWGMVPPPPDRRPPRNPDLVVAGPMARTAADLDLLLAVMAGPRDPLVASAPLAAPRQTAAKGLRVGVWQDEALAPVDALTQAAVTRAAQAFGADGAIVSPFRPPCRFGEIFEVFALLNHAIVAYGLPAKVRDKIASRAGQFAPGDLDHAALQARGARMTPSFYQELQNRRQRLRKLWAAVFDRVDIVLAPAAPVARLPHDAEPNPFARRLQVGSGMIPYLDFLKWAAPATGADLPAAVAPVGHAGDGLPLAVQIIGPPGGDRTAIAAAGMLERSLGGFVPPRIVRPV